MSAENDLHQLIHALSPSEKRYFKLDASRHVHGEKNNYVQLFDAIAAQKEYDEAKLKRRFAGKATARHLAAEKNQLFRQILKSMRTFHDRNTPVSDIQARLDEAHFLYTRGMYKRSRKHVKKALQLARDNQAYAQLIALLRLEARLITTYETRKAPEMLAQVAAEQADAVANMKFESQIDAVANRLFVLVRSEYAPRGSAMQQELAKIEADLPSLDKLSALPLKLQTRVLHTHAYFQQLAGHFLSAQKYYQAALTIWESTPKAILAQQNVYLISISNYLSICHSLNEYEDFPKALEKIKQLSSPISDEAAEAAQNILHLELIYYMNSNQFELALDHIPKIQSAFRKYRNKFNLARRMTISGNIAILYFILDDYSRALKWVNEILQYEREIHRNDIYRFARLMEMILHYELGNTDLIDSFYRSSSRYLRRKGELFQFEATILKVLRQVSNRPHQESPSIFGRLVKQLNALHAANQVHFTGFNEVLCWARSRANGLSMRDQLIQSL